MADSSRGQGSPALAWLGVWCRAVIEPASRRAGAVWIGSGIVGAVVFGPTGLRPAELTTLCLANPGVGAMLALTWLMLFVPTARVIMRGDGARYLRSLPSPARATIVVAAAALLAFQLPWLALWIVGDGLRGLGIVLALSTAIVVIARWEPPRPRPRAASWHGAGQALRAMHRCALRRRAGDALIRGTGLALLAGIAGGLFVRNNHLVDAPAAILGASVITIVLVPAQVGVLFVLLDAHRKSTWLASSLGIAPATRIAALVAAVALVHASAAAISLAAAAVFVGADGTTFGYLAGTTLTVAMFSALGVSRMLLAAEAAPSSAARAVTGAIVVAAIAVLWLGLLGVPGLLAIAATALLAILTVPA